MRDSRSALSQSLRALGTGLELLGSAASDAGQGTGRTALTPALSQWEREGCYLRSSVPSKKKARHAARMSHVQRGTLGRSASALEAFTVSSPK